ncbi:MAG TPA: response regulator [Desulfobacteraceae bacterium]|nr:response regulator [Desulfobacteraceae bacterium]
MSEKSLLKDKKILIVDDEPDILEVLEEYLSDCKLTKATNFDDAKRFLESEKFDAAILDIMGVNGYKLLEISQEKKVPALMLTAHAFSPDNIVKSMKEGAASYVPKDEINRIRDFLNDIFLAMEKGVSPWESWQKRLPGSYFEMKFGAAWKVANQEFRDALRAALQSRAKS